MRCYVSEMIDSPLRYLRMWGLSRPIRLRSALLLLESFTRTASHELERSTRVQ